MDTGEFTLEQLRRGLALELTRADASFVRSQIAARLALARDLLPGSERISAPPLEVERLDLTLGLVAVRPGVLKRLWRQISGWWSGPPPAVPVRYRFAAPGEGGVQFTCVIRRDARGRFRSHLDQA